MTPAEHLRVVFRVTMVKFNAQMWLEKSRDYVFGKYQFNVLSMKSYLRVNWFESKIIDKTVIVSIH